MKKFLGFSAVALAGLLAFTGCGKATEAYYGSYSYVAYGHTYGTQVKVSVKDGKVTKVEMASDEKTGWVSLSDKNENAGWTDAKRAEWTNNKEEFLKKFEGKTVDECLAMTTTIRGVNEATADSVEGIDEVTGATQSSARVVEAVKDALREYKAFH